MDADLDGGTVAELVGQALTAARVAEETDDWDEYWTVLRRAGADGPGALPLGLKLVGSHDPVERGTGCDLLGDASDQDEEVRAETAAALVSLAERETDGGVLWSLARAIGRTQDQRAVPVLVALAEHPEADVRQQVATSFSGVATGLPDGPDVRALVALTRDDDPEVRNWATFTLGFQVEADSPAIRAVLWERTTDEHPETREEGIRGLARRHDLRVVPLLTELLDDPTGAHVLTFSAARIMGIPELLPALRAYQADGAEIGAVVNACDPVERARSDASAWDLLCALDLLRPDLAASVSVGRFDAGLRLGLGAGRDSPDYDVEALLGRAGGDPAHAAALVASDWQGRS